MKIQHITEGVRRSGDDDFILDMRQDYENDIIKTYLSNELYYSSIDNNAYYFGYQFKDNISSKDRTAFIKWLKSHNKMTKYLNEFINRPVVRLMQEKEIKDVKLLLCPKSNRSNLVPLIMQSINNVMSRSVRKDFIEIVKNFPNNITADYEALKVDCESSAQYRDRKRNLDLILDKIKDLSYFSLADNVKTKYRPYIQNYLAISEEDKKVLDSVENGNILLVDDINTSGSTIRECIRVIHDINPTCQVYVFTLIGK